MLRLTKREHISTRELSLHPERDFSEAPLHDFPVMTPESMYLVRFLVQRVVALFRPLRPFTQSSGRCKSDCIGYENVSVGAGAFAHCAGDCNFVGGEGFLLYTGQGNPERLGRREKDARDPLGKGPVDSHLWAQSPLSYLTALPAHPVEPRARRGSCRFAPVRKRHGHPNGSSHPSEVIP
jgi:hypothetical protein